MDNKLNSAGLSSWDNDFNEFGARKGGLADQSGRTQADEDQLHKHQLEMELLQKQLDELSKSRKGKMIIHLLTGDVEYTAQSGNTYKKKFGLKDNSFLLLMVLASKPFTIHGFDTLGKVLTSQRRGANSTEERRVRDTIKAIRSRKNGFGLPDEDNIFIVDYGFGLNCDVEFTR